MEIMQINQFPRETIEQLLSAVSFYNTVKQQDSWQFEVLLQHSHIVNFAPGEVVLQRGEKDCWLYFLLKGQLAVYPGDSPADEAVNYITPGEVFGDLAMLIDRERTATVVADSNCRKIMVFGTDFKAFGELDDTRTVNLQTKLTYYRNTVHSLRWKLEVYRMKYPHYALADKHHRVSLYSGVKDTLEELRSLNRQAQDLAHMLIAWNQAFGRLSVPDSAAPSPQLLAAMSL